MDEFRYSTAHFPLVIVTCPARFEATNVKTVLDAYSNEVFEGRRKFVLVVDALGIKELPSALVRRAITDWMQRVESIGQRYTLGMAMATPSAIVRGAMTAVNWVVPPKIPMSYEPTMAAAVDWAIARLESANEHVPAAVRAYRASLGRAAS